MLDDRRRVYMRELMRKRRAAGLHLRHERHCIVCSATFRTERADADHCSVVCINTVRAEKAAKANKSRARERQDVDVLTSILAKPTRREVVAYRAALRRDPCAYCGQPVCGGIDHIDPAARHADRKDLMNMTGCCKRCNETKSVLPLILALEWIPLSRAYNARRRLLFTPAG